MRYALTEALSQLFGMDIKERGVNALLLCPFHDESTPSFSVHLEEGVWHCFGCGKKGGLKKLYREFGEVMSDDLYHDRLMKSINEIPEQRKNFYVLSDRLYKSLICDQAYDIISGFFSARSISFDAADKFKIGFDSSKSAIAFPYWDNENMSVSGIKYRYGDGSKRAEPGSLFGLYNVDDARGKQIVIVCEGESDTMSMWSNLPRKSNVGVVGISGAVHDRKSWERWGLDMMFASRVYLALDNDDAGRKGTQSATDVLGDDKCVIIVPTHGKDISEHFINGGTIADLGLEDSDLGLR